MPGWGGCAHVASQSGHVRLGTLGILADALGVKLLFREWYQPETKLARDLFFQILIALGQELEGQKSLRSALALNPWLSERVLLRPLPGEEL